MLNLTCNTLFHDDLAVQLFLLCYPFLTSFDEVRASPMGSLNLILQNDMELEKAENLKPNFAPKMGA